MLTAPIPELLHAVGYLTGATLYAMLFAMVARAGTPDRLALMAAGLGLVWNAGEMLLHVPLGAAPIGAGLTGIDPWLAALACTSLGLLAAVVLHSVARTALEPSRGMRRLVAMAPLAAYGAAVLAGVFHFNAAARGLALPSPSGLEIVTAGLILASLPVVLETRRQGSGRWPVWTVALAVFAVSALHLGRFHGAQESWLIELLGHHASIPLAFAMLYRDYRFALADLFLKQALTLLALVAVVIAGYAGLEPLLERGGSLAVTLLIGAWIATALLFPIIRGAVVWFVDRVVLSRGNAREMLDELARVIEACDTTEAVLSRACAELGKSLGASSVAWQARPPGAVIEPGAGVVWTTEEPQYVVSVGALAGGRRLLSGDVTSIERAATLVARRIDALRLTEERYERMLREQEITALATEAELRALRAQVNPHFLFNTLTTLGHLIQHAPPRALTTLMRLTTLLRGVLRSDGELTTLGRERELIRCYLDIERERFEERLTTEIDIPDDLYSIPVPALIVQPLVENAIKHGIARTRLGGRVQVTARIEPGAPAGVLLIAVINSGAVRGPTSPYPVPDRGSTPGTRPGVEDGGGEWAGDSNGVGLQLVARRLRASYGDAASVSLRRDEAAGVTIAELRLPARGLGEMSPEDPSSQRLVS